MSKNTHDKQRLLIVDDSRVIRVTARKILRDHFETVEAVDGEDAWEMLTGAEPFALVVSDLTMPRLDGFGLLERIRSSHLPQVRELPVIIITGANDSEATMQRAREVGATDFIGKPFDAVHLLARTQAYASSHATTNTLKEEKTVLEDQSTVDTTTGLCNEASFMERGYQQLSYAIRHCSTLAMFRIEIDDFGDLFQQYGEKFTASVIQAMGTTLASVVRQEDTAARVGTARFSLLLPGMEKTGVHNLAERIHRSFNSHSFMAGDHRVRATLSIGVGTPDIRRNYHFDELLAITDQRLNQAITQGGNQVIFEEAGTPLPLETVEAIPPAPVTLEPAKAEPFLDEVPVLASHNQPFIENDRDVEEIELHSADTAGIATKPDGYSIPEIECFAPDTPEPLPGRFAGPVPDNHVAAANAGIETSPGNAGSESGAVEGVPDVVPEAVAAPPDDPEMDAIIISAPFSSDEVSMPESWYPDKNPGTGTSNDPQENKDAGASPEDPDSTPRRKGFFKKTLGLFRRSR